MLMRFSRGAAVAVVVLIGLLKSVLAAPPDQVAITVYANDAASKKYERAVQARVESILSDAGITVLDEEKAKKLKNGWVDLADPGHLITAEEFIRNAGKYDVKRVYRVSFTTGLSNPLGLFFTATAAMQVRVIDEEAKVRSSSSVPMGVRGFPPSDALTADAALVNALQRAADSAAEAMGLNVLIPTMARVVPLTLVAEPVPPSGVTLEVSVPNPGNSWAKGAKFFADGGWTTEDEACKAVSDDGQLGVVGGYTHAKRGHGGRLHIIDIATAKELTVFSMHELGPRLSGENGSAEPFACKFLGSWRYLVAMTGNKISCFDVERGLETCSIPYSNGPKSGRLSVWKSGTDRFVKSETDKGSNFYRIALKK